MARIVQYTDFVSLRIRLMDQLFEFVGDSNELQFSSDIPVDSPTKTMLVKGTIYFQILDIGVADVTTAPGEILPTPLSATGKHFKVTALENDTHVNCIQPLYSTDKIIYVESNLAASETINIAIDNLVFVFGNNYKVQDGSYNGFHIFALRNQHLKGFITQ